MYTVISPAKRLNEGAALPHVAHTVPEWLDQSSELIATLREVSGEGIGKLMKISPALSELNSSRYKRWQAEPTPAIARQAVLSFAGDTYIGLNAETMNTNDLAYAQDHLGILSGLHGVLRPLDLLQPYRLEMGTRLANAHGTNLYAFWGHMIRERIEAALDGHAHPALINLASIEYFKAVKAPSLPCPVITPIFKEIKGGKAKVVAFVAKRARGTMARHIIENRIEAPEKLKQFTGMGYAFDAAESNENDWVFTRQAPPSSK
jgi:cytoplasmic iron level regulating protein YaaA (DUF328/UPF0246 family)